VKKKRKKKKEEKGGITSGRISGESSVLLSTLKKTAASAWEGGGKEKCAMPNGGKGIHSTSSKSKRGNAPALREEKKRGKKGGKRLHLLAEKGLGEKTEKHARFINSQGKKKRRRKNEGQLRRYFKGRKKGLPLWDGVLQRGIKRAMWTH